MGKQTMGAYRINNAYVFFMDILENRSHHDKFYFAKIYILDLCLL